MFNLWLHDEKSELRAHESFTNSTSMLTEADGFVTYFLIFCGIIKSLIRAQSTEKTYSDQRFPTLSITTPVRMSMVLVQKEKKSLAIVQKLDTGRYRYNAVIFFRKSSQQKSHSSPVRARYGISFVSTNYAIY